MANSSYYYGQYISYKSQVAGLERNIQDLTKIQNNLTNDFYDEQSNVNGELDDLKEDLNKSVRHDREFSNIVNSCESYKEKTTMGDGNLAAAVTALEDEIASLNVQKTSAEQSRDANYQSYLSAKEEEHRAWLESLKNIFS